MANICNFDQNLNVCPKFGFFFIVMFFWTCFCKRCSPKNEFPNSEEKHKHYIHISKLGIKYGTQRKASFQFSIARFAFKTENWFIFGESPFTWVYVEVQLSSTFSLLRPKLIQISIYYCSSFLKSSKYISGRSKVSDEVKKMRVDVLPLRFDLTPNMNCR